MSKTATPVQESPGNYNVKIDPRLVRKLKMAAPAFGMTVPEYIHDRLSKIVDPDLEAAFGSLGLEQPKQPS